MGFHLPGSARMAAGGVSDSDSCSPILKILKLSPTHRAQGHGSVDAMSKNIPERCMG